MRKSKNRNKQIKKQKQVKQKKIIQKQKNNIKIEKDYLNYLVKDCNNAKKDFAPSTINLSNTINLSEIFVMPRIKDEGDYFTRNDFSISYAEHEDNSNNEVSFKIRQRKENDIDDDLNLDNNLNEISSIISILVHNNNPEIRKMLLEDSEEQEDKSIKNNNSVKKETDHKKINKLKYRRTKKKLNKNSKSLKNIDSLVTNNESNFEKQEYKTKPVHPSTYKNPTRKVILAPPGYGKTTLSKRIALAYGLNENDFKKEYLTKDSLFPIILYCKYLQNIELKEKDDFIKMAYEITKAQYKELSFSESEFSFLFKTHLKNQSLLLLINGLDEIIEEEKGLIFTKALVNFLNENNKANLILTLEEGAFSNLINNSILSDITLIENLEYCGIEPLNEEEKAEYIKKWFDSYFIDKINVSEISNKVIKQLKSETYHYLNKIASIPYHLSNILLVSIDKDGIPTNKLELYEEYIKLSLNWKIFPSMEPEDLLMELSYIAYSMTKNKIQSIDKKNLKKLLLEGSYNLDGLFINPINNEDINSYLKYLTTNNILLRKCASVNGIDFFEFDHSLLQEYLTAYAIKCGLTEDSDELTALEILKKNYNLFSFSQVIPLTILMLNSDQEKEEIIKFFINIAQEENLSFVQNILFDLILNDISISIDFKYSIFEFLFKSNLTRYQAKQLIDFFNDPRSNELKEFLSLKYKESINQNDFFSWPAFSLISALEIAQQGENPYEVAQKLFLSNDNSKFFMGMNIFSVLSWITSENITNYFKSFNKTLSKSFIDKVKKTILDINENSDLSMLYIFIKMLSDLTWTSTEENYLSEKEIFVKCLENIKKENLIFPMFKLISLFPIRKTVMNWNINIDISSELELLKNEYEIIKKRVINDLNNGEERKIPINIINALISIFRILTILGAFNDKNFEVFIEFKELRLIINDLYRDKEFSKGLVTRLVRTSNDLIFYPNNPTEKGLELYINGEFEEAKKYFLLGAVYDRYSNLNSLGYMLRRGEIKDLEGIEFNGKKYYLVVDNEDANIENIFNEGIKIKDLMYLINYSLYKFKIGKNYDHQSALNYLIKNVDYSKDFHKYSEASYSWWQDLAKAGDDEGFVVLYWLEELKKIWPN